MNVNQSSGKGIWSAPRVVVVSPRHNQSDIRVANKIGRSLHEQSFETFLCVRSKGPGKYLEMRAVPVPMILAESKYVASPRQ